MLNYSFTRNYLNKDSADYSEEAQTSNIKFSVASLTERTFNILYVPFRCKDFLTELLHSRLLKEIPSRVYNFEVKRVWDEDIYLVVTSSSLKEIQSIKENFNFIHDFENVMGIPEDKYSKLFYSTGGTTFAIKPSEEWFLSPVGVSLYTALVRALSYAAVINSKLNRKGFKLESFDELKEYLLNEHIYNSDSRIFNKLFVTNKYFDLTFFLKNYLEIIKDEPVTGYDDEKAAHAYTLPDKCFGIEAHGMNRIYYSSQMAHNASGIMNLIVNIDNFKSYLERRNLNVGYTWARNYLRLIK